MKSVLLHLRIPFSFFLMPVYFFALAVSPNFTESRLIWSFLIIHLMLYPASNAYNSYFDRDEKSIGGLKNPPPVNRGLYYAALLLDVIALVIGYIKISFTFSVMLVVYGLVSKAYSHPLIRLKKYPYLGWITIGVFQGFFALMMSYIGINRFELHNLFQPKLLFGGLLTTIMLLGSYPMTQIYQHEEDKKHGDETISRRLGIKGTFYFVLSVFTMASAGFVLYFNYFFEIRFAWLFIASLSPVVLFFLVWFARVWKDESNANFSNTMWLNFISATCLNIFFIYFWLQVSHVGQTF